jgi:hypothetical protein
VNGKCFCGAPNCIGSLFPRIIRGDQESGDEGGDNVHPDEGSEVRSEGEGIEDEGGDADGGDEVAMDI